MSQSIAQHHSTASLVKAAEFLAFKLGNEEYGVDIRHVQELRGYSSVTHLANAPEYLKGVINLRGMIVPIIDMRIKFRLGLAHYDQFTVVIVLNIDDHVIGMVVDAVSDVVALRSEDIKPAPHIGTATETTYVIGLGVLEGRMVMLMEIRKLLSSTDLGLIEAPSAQE